MDSVLNSSHVAEGLWHAAEVIGTSASVSAVGAFVMEKAGYTGYSCTSMYAAGALGAAMTSAPVVCCLSALKACANSLARHADEAAQQEPATVQEADQESLQAVPQAMDQTPPQPRQRASNNGIDLFGILGLTPFSTIVGSAFIPSVGIEAAATASVVGAAVLVGVAFPLATGYVCIRHHAQLCMRQNVMQDRSR